MDDDTLKMERLLSILKEKHKQVDGLMTLTKDMENVIERNDMESLGAVLSMRQESMDRIDKLIGDTKESLVGMEPEIREKAIKLLTPSDEPLALYEPLETNIFETNRMTLALLKKIIDLDESINKKVQRSAAPSE